MQCFADKAKSYNADVTFLDANNSEITQSQQLAQAIDDGAKVIVLVALNVNTAPEIVRKAKSKGVKIIALDRLIRNCDIDYYISFDSEKVGEIMAKEALNLKPKGKYAILFGDKRDNNAVLIQNGTMKVLQPHVDSRNIDIVYKSYIEDWSYENAYNEFDKIIRLRNEEGLDAVLASTDRISRAAIDVLKNYNLLDNTFISGQNAETPSLKLVLKGEQTITVYKSPRKLGEIAAELAISMVYPDKKINIEANTKVNNGFKDVSAIIFDPVLINKSNVEKEILPDNLIKREELF